MSKKNNIEKNLITKLMQANTYDEIEDVLRCMLSMGIRIEKYIDTTVYRKLVLNNKNYKEYDRIKRFLKSLPRSNSVNNFNSSKLDGNYKNSISIEQIKSKTRKMTEEKVKNNTISRSLQSDKIQKIESVTQQELVEFDIVENNSKVFKKVFRVKRKQNIVNYLKRLYNDTCQICGERLYIGNNNYLSEVHHIKPLSQHNGADVIKNMIVLCPNHHVLFDRGVITLDLENNQVIHIDKSNSIHGSEVVLKHKIDKKYIDYYNEKIYIGNKNKTGGTKINVESKEYMHFERDGNQITYGDRVILTEANEGYGLEITLENEVNKLLMTDVQKKILDIFDGDEIIFNDYKYRVQKVKEKNEDSIL